MLLCEIVVGQLYDARPRGYTYPVVAKFVKQNPTCPWWWEPVYDDMFAEFSEPVLVINIGALRRSPLDEPTTPSWAICLWGERLVAIDPYYLSPSLSK